MFKRDISSVLLRYSKFPVVGLLGPRQSGKTTLVKSAFKKHKFLSFEDPETRSFAQNDPKRFLKVYENEYGVILDEFQYVPEILSHIQLEVDEKKRPGYFILTGSQNFLANQAISQSLAGRIGILTLLPLSIKELSENKLLQTEGKVDEVIFSGGYPRLYDQNFLPTELYPAYIQSYIERDIRELMEVGNLSTFQKFLQLCAGRIGQLLNISGLANECGINFQTARQWLSILEASYIIFLLQPHYKNFNKRLTKSPKIYFFDTGIACSLLRISSAEILSLHPLRGNLFECFMIADIYKQYLNLGIRPPIYFWRDQNGRYEVDCLLDEGLFLIPLEIKSGQTIVSDYFKNLQEWNTISNNDPSLGYIVYGGSEVQARTAGNIISWQHAKNLVEKIKKKF